jgi:phosphate transport system substrate-binding protein
MVENTPEGFATTGFTSGRKRQVRMLKVDGISPSAKNIIQGKYPLKRPLFILVPKRNKPAVKQFVDFAMSKEGQAFIRSLGVVSLHDIK